MKLNCLTCHKRIQTHNKGLFYVSAAGSKENNRIKCAQVGDGDPPAWTGCCCRGKGTCSLQASLIQCKQRAFWGFSAAFLAYSVRPVMQIAEGRPDQTPPPPPERTAVLCVPLQCAENDREPHAEGIPRLSPRKTSGTWVGGGGKDAGECGGVAGSRPGLPAVATFAASAGRPWRLEWVQSEPSTA